MSDFSSALSDLGLGAGWSTRDWDWGSAGGAESCRKKAPLGTGRLGKASSLYPAAEPDRRVFFADAELFSPPLKSLLELKIMPQSSLS